MPEHVTPETKAHPVLFLILFIPLGVSNGYVVVSLGYLLTQHGVSVASVAVLASISLAAQFWKFLWAPLVDTTLTSRAGTSSPARRPDC